MISYIPASCFNYMIDEKNQKQGVGLSELMKFWRFDESKFWWK